MAVSYIGGGNRSTLRKPATCRKWLTNVITLLHRAHLVMWGIRTLVVVGTDCTIHMISTTMAPVFIQTRIHSQSIHSYHMVVMLFAGNLKKVTWQKYTIDTKRRVCKKTFNSHAGLFYLQLAKFEYSLHVLCIYSILLITCDR